jgi:hypothetical protein
MTRPVLLRRPAKKVYYLYSINFPNEKKYFGISMLPTRRWKQHLDDSKNNSNLSVHAALRKYKDASFTILVKGEEAYICALEIAAIEKFQTRNPKFGYNIAAGGQISPMLDDRVRAKVSAALVGKPGQPRSLETREKMRITRSTPEARAKNSAAQLGKKRGPRTIEHRKNLSLSHSTPEARARNRAVHLGRIVTLEARAKMRAAKLGKPHIHAGHAHSNETRAKMRAAKLGKRATLETRAKMSAAKLGKPHPHAPHNHSLETRSKIRIATAGRSGFFQKATCPHCNKEGGAPAMRRWHFDNCPKKETS